MGHKKPKGLADGALKALAGETVKFARAQVVLDKTEAALERELERERTHVPTTKIAKARKKGEHLIHAKYVLLAVVLLNVIDCCLVLGELMLDIKYVTDLLTKSENSAEGLITSMKDLYPTQLDYLGETDIDSLKKELTAAHIDWSGSHGAPDGTNSSQAAPSHIRKRAASGSTGNETSTHGEHRGHEHAHSIEETIAHALHKASITILGILVVETFFKIFCLGTQMKEHKLECFDAAIVVISFVLDLVLIEGLQQFEIGEFVLILAFLVPWRVIRVVNSLVVAIMDHEHFRLKVVYKQKKKISHELKESKTEIKGLAACVDALEKLCSTAGILDPNIQAKLNMYRKLQAKTNVTGALSSFAMGGDALMKPIPTPRDIEITMPEENHNTPGKDLEGILHGNANGSVRPLESLVGNSTSVAGSVLAGKPDIEDILAKVGVEGNRIRKHKDSSSMPELSRFARSTMGFLATINKDEFEAEMKTRSRRGTLEVVSETDTEGEDNDGVHPTPRFGLEEGEELSDHELTGLIHADVEPCQDDRDDVTLRSFANDDQPEETDLLISRDSCDDHLNE